ncbi:MAG: hypothetical protein KA288_08040 [Paludibacteraceae bacterium]|jgi:hypothetical protein|nr:hypothetical protein [Paludibacteraceae bacterium]
MKNKNIFLFSTIFIIVMIAIFTYLFSNIWMIVTDQTNYVPKESNIFFFHPTKIDEGSGGYWRYGEDLNNFYYFSEKEENVYFSHSKNSNCKDFKKIEISTWCNPTKNNHK